MARPSDANNTIRARVINDTATVEARNTASNRSRSPAFKTNGAAIIGIRHHLNQQPQRHLRHTTLGGALLLGQVPAFASDTEPPAEASQSATQVEQALQDTVPAVVATSGGAQGTDADSVMTASVPGALIDVPRDGGDAVLLRPDDATSVPLHTTSRDLAVDDAQAATLAGPAVEEPSATDESADPAAARPDAAGTAAPSTADRTVSVTVPGGDDAGAGQQVRPGLTVFPDSDVSASQAVQSSTDGSARFLTVIEGPAAPTEYRYEIGLAQGGSLVAQPDGSVLALAPPHEGRQLPTARIAAPWAVDAAHRDLPASFTVDGDALVLHVEHKGAAYPVTADPELFFFHYFSPASPYAEGGSMYGASVGRFTSQVNYRNMQRLSMQWSFQLSYGERARCNANYHAVQQFARAAAFHRMTRYTDDHTGREAEGCDYRWHSSISKYQYADDGWFASTHYLRGYIGMPLSLWVSLQYATGPRSVHQIHVYADYIL